LILQFQNDFRKYKFRLEILRLFVFFRSGDSEIDIAAARVTKKTSYLPNLDGETIKI
jgi:hypothetical protein